MSATYLNSRAVRQRYGNTSSASLLIALSECKLSGPTVLAVFGAGLNWGAVLVT